ncbi:MAG: MipA/OmpV family protein [Pseudomonadota bacterium]
MHSLLLVAAFSAGNSARADDGIRLSFGTVVEAKYFGADVQEVPQSLSIIYKSGDFGIEATPRSARLFWTASPDLTFGTLIRRHAGRENVEDAAVNALRSVPATVEAGLFVRTKTEPASLSAEVAGDILGETNGVVGEIGASVPIPVADQFTLVSAVGLFGANDAFADAFFSVEQTDVAASGLPWYEASGGVLGAAEGLSACYLFSQSVSASGSLRYIQLAGDAADSPIVSERGSRDQVVASLGLTVGF